MKIKLSLTTKITGVAILAIVFMAFNRQNSDSEQPLKSAIIKKKKPNIIFLLTDDQRYNALGCMGNEEIQTPHIDKLAEQGVVFTNNYNNTAICMVVEPVL